MLFGRVILTKKELNARENRAYFEGYNQGYSAGKQWSIFESTTLNAFREAIGLPPIADKSEDDCK